MKNYRNDFSVEAIWGSLVKDGGFVIIPKDLLYNLGDLGIKDNQVSVLMIMLSYQGKRRVSAQRISRYTGLHINTVRAAIKKLAENSKVIDRRFGHGEATIYTYPELVNRIQVYANNRQTLIQNLDMGLDDIYTFRNQDIGNNKETKNKEKDGGSGFDNFKQSRKSKGI